MWADSLHSKPFLDVLLKIIQNMDETTYATKKKMTGMVTIAKSELDTPFFYMPPLLAKHLHTQCPPLKEFISAILNGGYLFSQSHSEPGSVKTDAPSSFIWDIMRAWVKKNPIKEEWLKEGSITKNILDKECETEISFALHPGAVFDKSITRYQYNPPNWGPATKAKKRKEPES
jgi:tRNA (guanine26-N2/guanine27-N2)-dimethyltransferase